MPKPFNAPRARLPRPPKLAGLAQASVFTRGPRDLQRSLLGNSAVSYPLPPGPDFPATDTAEWAVWWVLTRILHMRPQQDFIYQYPVFSGRTSFAGSVLDFFINDGSGIAMNIQGSFFHTVSAEQFAHDRDLRVRLLTRQPPIVLIFIDADALERNAVGLVKDALRGIDRSRTGRGG